MIHLITITRPVSQSRVHKIPYKMQSTDTLANLIRYRPAMREEWKTMWLAGFLYTRSHETCQSRVRTLINLNIDDLLPLIRAPSSDFKSNCEITTFWSMRPC